MNMPNLPQAPLEPIEIVETHQPKLARENDLFGGVTIKLDDFPYVRIGYNHRYTDNAARDALAEHVLAYLRGSPAVAPATPAMSPDFYIPEDRLELALSWMGCAAASQKPMSAEPDTYLRRLIDAVLRHKSKTEAARAAEKGPVAVAPAELSPERIEAERVAFENWMTTDNGTPAANLKRYDNGDFINYIDDRVHDAWKVWLARARAAVEPTVNGGTVRQWHDLATALSNDRHLFATRDGDTLTALMPLLTDEEKRSASYRDYLPALAQRAMDRIAELRRAFQELEELRQWTADQLAEAKAAQGPDADAMATWLDDFTLDRCGCVWPTEQVRAWVAQMRTGLPYIPATRSADLRPAAAEGDDWKCGRQEFKLFHPAASHVEPAYRDGWNDCFRRAAVELAALRVRLQRLESAAADGASLFEQRIKAAVVAAYQACVTESELEAQAYDQNADTYAGKNMHEYAYKFRQRAIGYRDCAKALRALAARATGQALPQPSELEASGEDAAQAEGPR